MMNTRTTRILSLVSIFALVFAMIAPGVRADDPITPTAEFEDIDADDTNIEVSDERFEDGFGTGDLNSYVSEIGSDGDTIESFTGGEVDLEEEIVADGNFTGFNLTGDIFTGGNHYEVRYVYDDGDGNSFVGAAVVQGAEDHKVDVSATVLPVLEFTVDGDDIDFGEFEPGEFKEGGSTNVKVTTNALDISVTASFSALEDNSENHIKLGLYSESGEDDFASIGDTAEDGDVETYDLGLDETGNEDVYYYAEASEYQPAGDYSTTVEYTVTGNF